jgi:3-oxoacyl-[acyl-carrier protein] reductase
MSTAGPLAGERAIITGASRGIGRAVALELARQGAEVVGTATSAAGTSAIEAHFSEAGLSVTAMVLDVATPVSVETFFKVLSDNSLVPSILVNNAGITRDNLLVRMSNDEWNSVLETNLSGSYRMCRAVARPMMKARGGRIINITSVVGVSGNAGQSNYAAAKAGLIGFTKALARELGSRNITVNAVAPGFVETDMTDALPPEKRDALVSQIPLNRLGSVHDIAASVAFLAGPGATYITGSTLHVNGGIYMA